MELLDRWRDKLAGGPKAACLDSPHKQGSREWVDNNNNSMMAKQGCDMEKEENLQEDRRWMTDDVRVRINGRQYNK